MTQIYGTFGPACESQVTLEAMFHAGMTGMRLNLSHCNLTDSAEQISKFHAAAQAVGISPQLVIDTQGPELRIGTLDKTILKSNDSVILGEHGIPVPSAVLSALENGDEVLLDDGKIALMIKDAKQGRCTVTRGGILTGRKSIKVPGKKFSLPLLTERDIRNIQNAFQYGVTGLLQPFVQCGADLIELRKLLQSHNAGHLRIFAKIENMEGVASIHDIIPHADVIVIARGDLGNDMPLWQLPAVQKDLAAACRNAGKPFIVVTQMLASMEHSAVPTRAEVSDIFNAVVDGAWGVMLTGETAVGQYPVEAIQYLTNTARDAARWVNSQ